MGLRQKLSIVGPQRKKFLLKNSFTTPSCRTTGAASNILPVDQSKQGANGYTLIDPLITKEAFMSTYMNFTNFKSDFETLFIRYGNSSANAADMKTTHFGPTFFLTIELRRDEIELLRS